MRLLTFLAAHFRWRSHSKTLEEVADREVADGLEDVVVVFLHAEARDQEDQARRRALRQVVKHVKWLAGKRSFTRVALHSFTHLGAENAEPAFAQAFLEEVAERLRGTGYEVKETPFGYFCQWELAVYGESLAKVWKEI